MCCSSYNEDRRDNGYDFSKENKRGNVLIIIPVKREADSIRAVIEEILTSGFSRDDILVVDGHSDDGTDEIVKSLGVSLIYQRGDGKADAIKSAVEEISRRELDLDYLVFIDGDYTYPASHIRELIKRAVEGKDLVIGARKYLDKGSMGLVYRFGNRVLTAIFNIMFGTRLSDVLSGLYIVRLDILRELLFETKGFSIESEIVAHVASTGGEIDEIPIRYRRRLNPKAKKLNVLKGLRICCDMIRLAWRYNPTLMIFLAGSLMLVPGLALGLYVAYHHFFVGITYFVKGLVAIMLTLAGFQSLLLAILTLYLKRSEIRIMKRLRKITREDYRRNPWQ